MRAGGWVDGWGGRDSPSVAADRNREVGHLDSGTCARRNEASKVWCGPVDQYFSAKNTMQGCEQ